MIFDDEILWTKKQQVNLIISYGRVRLVIPFVLVVVVVHFQADPFERTEDGIGDVLVV